MDEGQNIYDISRSWMADENVESRASKLSLEVEVV